MAQYNYTAVNKQGEKVKAVMDAANEAEVRLLLRALALRPVSISKASVTEVDLFKLLKLGSNIKLNDTILFTRQLSILVGSGIPLVHGLEIIGSQCANSDMKTVILSIKDKITGGKFLWEAMSSHKDAFSDIYVSMIKAGEAAGALDAIFKRLIKYLDDADKLRKMVKGAMMYPVIVSVVGVVVVIGMLVFVIPKFETLLKSSNQELPLLTQLVVNSSHFAQNNILFILAGIGAAVFLTKTYLKTAEGKRFFDYQMMSLPLFGDVVNKVAVARFSRTMQTLLTSGVNLLDALDICKDAVGNIIIAEAIVKMKGEIEQGKTLSSIMGKMKFFPAMAVQMVTVGESTGNIDKMLEKVADWYEEEVQNGIQNMTKLIEPVVLVVLGGLVAGMLLAMYLPIFKMSGGA